jgi:hypothetical protein
MTTGFGDHYHSNGPGRRLRLSSTSRLALRSLDGGFLIPTRPPTLPDDPHGRRFGLVDQADLPWRLNRSLRSLVHARLVIQ